MSPTVPTGGCVGESAAVGISGTLLLIMSCNTRRRWRRGELVLPQGALLYGRPWWLPNMREPSYEGQAGRADEGTPTLNGLRTWKMRRFSEACTSWWRPQSQISDHSL